MTLKKDLREIFRNNLRYYRLKNKFTQEDLFEKINLEDYTNAQKLASCYHSYVRNAIIEADEKSTQESDEGHRVKAAFRKSGSKSAY